MLPLFNKVPWEHRGCHPVFPRPGSNPRASLFGEFMKCDLQNLFWRRCSPDPGWLDWSLPGPHTGQDIHSLQLQRDSSLLGCCCPAGLEDSAGIRRARSEALQWRGRGVQTPVSLSWVSSPLRCRRLLCRTTCLVLRPCPFRFRERTELVFLSY
jgi:hypothetical protein